MRSIGKAFDVPKWLLTTLYVLLFIKVPGMLTDDVSSADDNTSGVIAALILSDLLKEYKNNVKFIFFDKEEWGLFGSRSFIENNTNSLNKNSKVINLDCIGRGECIILSSQDTKHFQSKLKKKFANYLNQKNIPFRISNTSMSDCRNFAKKGYEAFTIQRKDIINGKNVLNWIHTREDIIDLINFNKIEEIINLVRDYITEHLKNS